MSTRGDIQAGKHKKNKSMVKQRDERSQGSEWEKKRKIRDDRQRAVSFAGEFAETEETNLKLPDKPREGLMRTARSGHVARIDDIHKNEVWGIFNEKGKRIRTAPSQEAARELLEEYNRTGTITVRVARGR